MAYRTLACIFVYFFIVFTRIFASDESLQLGVTRARSPLLETAPQQREEAKVIKSFPSSIKMLTPSQALRTFIFQQDCEGTVEGFTHSLQFVLRAFKPRFFLREIWPIFVEVRRSELEKSPTHIVCASLITQYCETHNLVPNDDIYYGLLKLIQYSPECSSEQIFDIIQKLDRKHTVGRGLCCVWYILNLF
jgi:hypothetical protein